jgi:hypothetical protein
MGEPENPTQHTDDDTTDNTSGIHSSNRETHKENCYNNNEDIHIDYADHEFQRLFPIDSQAQQQEEAEMSNEEDNFDTSKIYQAKSHRDQDQDPRLHHCP